MDDPNGDEKMTSSLDASSVLCSICLDLVTDNGDRSIAKLKCGHEFHLDCIGSAFNVKRAMQCPNCRKLERGQWLFESDSPCSFPEFLMDGSTPDDFALNYSEMPLGVHWCPFSGLPQLHSSIEEMESASTYHNLQRHQPLFAEHTSASSMAHSYVAYLGPFPTVSSNTNENVEDPNFNHHWNGLTGQNEIFTARSFPVIDVQYQGWGHHSYPVIFSSGHVNSTERASVTPATLRPAGAEYNAMTRYVHPSFHGHGNRRSHERTSASHVNGTHHQQQLSNPPRVLPPLTIPLVRRSTNGLRGSLATPQSDQSGGFFNFFPPGSSRRNPHETENPPANRIREINHLLHPVVSSNGESVWSPFRQAHGRSDSTNRSGNFWSSYRS